MNKNSRLHRCNITMLPAKFHSFYMHWPALCQKCIFKIITIYYLRLICATTPQFSIVLDKYSKLTITNLQFYKHATTQHKIILFISYYLYQIYIYIYIYTYITRVQIEHHRLLHKNLLNHSKQRVVRTRSHFPRKFSRSIRSNITNIT